MKIKINIDNYQIILSIMKTLRFLGIALLAMILCAGFTACSDDDTSDIDDITQNEDTSEDEDTFGDEDELIKVIHVETAGTLPTLMSEEEQVQVTDLTLSGYINGTDVKFIRGMGLKKVDFTEVHIVGGDSYYTYRYPYPSTRPPVDYHTSDNFFPNYCFYNGTLREIKLPNSVTRIGHSAFEKCRNLTSVEIPDGITAIGWRTFKDCTNLIAIKLPESITKIDNYAFENCTSLTSIEIPDGVTDIQYVFSGCTSLTSVEIPDGVTSMTSAFENCTSLTSIEIPDGVTDIGDYAFADTGLKEIHMKGSTPPNVSDSAFSTYAYVTLYVPVGSKEAYMAHKIWGKFGNIVEE